MCARYEHRQLTVACDLQLTDRMTRLEEWEELRDRHGCGAELIGGGARLRLREAAGPEVGDLIRREAGCCGFLDFELAADGDRVRLDITSPSAQGARVAAFLAGVDPTLADRI